jgi:thimet oligopeptidase
MFHHGGSIAEIGSLCDDDMQVLASSGDEGVKSLKIDMSCQSAERFEAMVEEALANAEAHLEKDASPPLESECLSSMKRLDEVRQWLTQPRGLAVLMSRVHPDERIRRSAETCRRRIATYDEGLIDRLWDTGFTGTALPDSHGLSLMVEQLKRHGVDQSPSIRAELQEINDQIRRLSTLYRRNLSADVREVPMVHEGQLDGVSSTFVDARRVRGSSQIRLTTAPEDLQQILRYCHDPSLRRAVYQAAKERGYPDNRPILERVLRLRQRYANLLGYSRWSDFQAAPHTLGSTDLVSGFLEELKDTLTTRVQLETSVLGEAKARIMGSEGNVEPWDWRYLAARLSTGDSSNPSAEPVDVLFEAYAMKDSVVRLVESFLSLDFRKLERVSVWHATVEAYEVVTAQGLLGHVFFDLESRVGKYPGFYTVPITSDSSGGPPSVVVVGSIRGTEGRRQQRLVPHSCVVGLLHELGHAIHHLCACDSEWISLAGLRGAGDGAEIVSGVFEELAWHQKSLETFFVPAGNRDSSDWVGRLLAARGFTKGIAAWQQLYIAAYSHELHGQDAETVNLDDFDAGFRTRFGAFPGYNVERLFARLPHLVAHDAAYFSYVFGAVVAQEIFSELLFEGALDEEHAQRFRHTVLASVERGLTTLRLKSFLGRSWSFGSYSHWLASS